MCFFFQALKYASRGYASQRTLNVSVTFCGAAAALTASEGSVCLLLRLEILAAS